MMMFIQIKRKFLQCSFLLMCTCVFIESGNALPTLDGDLTVENVTTSSVSLKWSQLTLPQGKYSLNVKYRFFNNWTATHLLEWSDDSTIEAKSLHETGITDYQSKVYDSVEVNSESKEIQVTVEGLFSDVMYEFQIVANSSDGQKSFISRSAEKRTDMDKQPTTIPYTAAGCFDVIGTTKTSRQVRVFWVDTAIKYEISLSEGNNLLPTYPKSEYGSKLNYHYQANISLNAHQFTFKSANEIGYSRKFSVLDIPAQRNLLPQLPVLMRWNQTTNSYLIFWTKLKTVDVKNYTLLWFDHHADRANIYDRLFNFLYIPNDKTSVVLKAGSQNPILNLGMSINTEDSSSGFKMIPLDVPVEKNW